MTRTTLHIALLSIAFCLGSGACAHALGSNALISAALSGNAEKARTLIDGGARVDDTTEHGWTALMVASREGHLAVVELLLEAGADPKRVSNPITGNTQAPVPSTTALRVALRGDHAAVARSLIDAGAPVDEAALTIAGGVDNLELLKTLLKDGADPTPALSLACQKGLTKNVAWLLENGADLDPKALGALPLRAAVNADQLEVVKLLLAKGANPNVPYSPDRATPLLHCITAHTRSSQFDPKCEMVKVLLENGADQEYRSSAHPYGNRDALEYATSKRNQFAPKTEESKFHRVIVAKLEAIIGMLEE